MRVYLLACRTIRNEIEQITEKYHLKFQAIRYVESGLHNHRKTLRAAIEKELSDLDIQTEDRLLLCFGLCGNVFDGMLTGNYQTVMPRSQDCITLLLGSRERRTNLESEQISYYLTRGWLYGKANMHREYIESCEKFGKSMADDIYRQIFDGYQSVTLIDTHRGDFEQFCKEGEMIAKDFKLQVRKCSADLSWLESYLLQDFDTLLAEHKLVIYPPESTMSFKDFI